MDTAPLSPPQPPVGNLPLNPDVTEPQINMANTVPIPGLQMPSAPTDPLAPVQAQTPPTSVVADAPPTYKPVSPLLEGIQQMSSSPFQDPTTVAHQQATTTNPINPNNAAFHETLPTAATAVPMETPSSPTLNSDGTAQPPTDGSNVPKKVSKFNFPLKGKSLFALLGGLVALVLIAVGAFWFLNNRNAGTGTTATTTKTTITYWGLWESPEIMKPLIDEYQQANPGVVVNYQQQNPEQYRSRVQAAVQAGNGPDIFRYHNTWVPMVKDSLAPAPASIFPATDMQQSYYPIMAQELISNNQVIGAPLMYEGLALLYNQSMLKAANALPPQDWKDVRSLAQQLTVKSGDRLQRGGIALGTADNVDNFSDILGLMMLQNGANPADPTSINTQTALQFYTIFSRSDQDWDNTMPESTLAFANEQVAMIFAPSWRIHDIRRLNPNLVFGVSRLPQLSDQKVTWASYWVEGVSKTSKNQTESWKFLAWLSQPDQLRKLYAQESKYRGFGELYPRVDMAKDLAGDAEVQPYLQDALDAQSWPLASDTHDDGLNDQLIQYYKDAVNKMNDSGNASEVLKSIAPGVQQVLSKFRVSVPGSTIVAPATSGSSS